MPKRVHNRETLRRVQVGLTGIVFIFTLLALGNAILTRLRPDASKNQTTTSVSSKSVEPLAKLGVAPAVAPENKSTPNAGDTSH